MVVDIVTQDSERNNLKYCLESNDFWERQQKKKRTNPKTLARRQKGFWKRQRKKEIKKKKKM